MQEIMEEVDLDQFVNQPVPDDPEKLRLSLIFSKDLITTLQQDIADLHHRLHIADTEYDGTNDIDDEEDDMRAGVHVTNATLTKMDMDMDNNDNDDDDDDNDDNIYNNNNNNINRNVNLYEMDDDNEDEDENQNQNQNENEEKALNKKQSEHEKFFSTYNILSKQINTQETLIESMGTYETLLYLSDNAITFNKIINTLQMQLKTAKDSFNILREALDSIDNEDEDEDEDDLEKKLFITNAKEILNESNKIVIIIDNIIDELNGAKHLIHPDQKKIFSLQSRITELQVSLPLHKIKKLAILNELPKFIKQELSDAKIQKQAEEARELQRLREQRKGHKKKRTKTLVDDNVNNELYINEERGREEEEERDKEEEEEAKELESERIENFNSTMNGVLTCINTLESRLNNISDTIEGIEADLDSMNDNDPIITLLNNSIDDIKNQIGNSIYKSLNDIKKYFQQTKEYIHPTQNILITAMNKYIEEKITNNKLQKEINILRNELETKEEQILILKKGKDSMNDNEQITQEYVNKITQQLREIRDKSISIHTIIKQEEINDDYDDDNNNNDDDTNNFNNFNNISDLKNKTSLSYDEIKKIDSDLTNLCEIFDELSISLINDENSLINLTPKNEYILQLEKRYICLKKLYRLKFTELESFKDNVIYNESVIKQKNEEIEELENRLIRIMTSASTSFETRMEAINTMTQKSQTYRTVMDLIDDNLRLSNSALNKIISNSQSNKEINNYCKTIKKGLESVQAEMSGARNFVHPDREMVHALQEQILNNNISNNNNIQINNSKVSFTDNNNNNNNNQIVNNKISNDRRTKSVHEIAWSRFNAGHETNMEDLEKKEREVLEEDIRNKILDEIQQEYDDKFDKAVAEIRAQLQQDIREQIRLEYEDLEAHISSQQQYNDNDEHEHEHEHEQQIDIEQIKMDLEDEYDKRLEKERKKIDEYYVHKEKAFESELNEKNEKNNLLQKECASMQNQITNLKQKENKFVQQIQEVSDSKLKLIKSTSTEIDALRDKIKIYTKQIDKLLNKINTNHDRPKNGY